MNNKNNTGQQIFTHITIGLQLAITMVIFVYGGYRLDLYFDKSPLFVAIGTVFGMVLGFYHLMKNLQDTERREERMKNGDGTTNRRRKKWN